MGHGDGFLRGALILTVAGLASRAVGAAYRVFLYPVLGPEGIGLFQMAYPVYSMLLVFSTAGANVALSRMVSESLGRGSGHGVAHLFRVVLLSLAVGGGVLSAGLFGGATWLATALYREPRAAPALAAVAPAVFLVALLSGYRGLFQGYERMYPPALSQVLEQLVRVGTMFALAWLLLDYGIPFAAAGAAFGAVTGAAAATAYLAWSARSLPGVKAASPAGGAVTTWGLLREFIRQAVPVSVTGGIFTLVGLVDVVVPGRLRDAGLTADLATAWYGRLTGGAMPLVNLPSLFTASLQLALVPAVARLLAARDRAGVLRTAATGIRLTVLVNAGAALGLAVLGQPISVTLYGDPLVGQVLRPLALSALFLGLQQTTAGVLQGMGQMTLPVWHLSAAAVVKLAVTWFLVGDPRWGVVGAAWGSVAGFGVAAGLGWWSLRRSLGPVIGVADVVLRPLAALTVMALCLPAIYEWGVGLIGRQWGGTLLAVAGGAVLYLVAALVVGGLKAEDLEVLPARWRRLGRWLTGWGLLRR